MSNKNDPDGNDDSNQDRLASLEPSTLETLATWYEGKPVIQTLIGILIGLLGPIGVALGSLEKGLLSRVVQIREERLRAFFDELASGRIELTEEIIQQKDFLHAFMATTRAVLNTRRKEKIQLFARLLASLGQGLEGYSIDDFEDSLNILDDLSHREFLLLLILRKYEEQTATREDENKLQQANRFWDQFADEASKELDIPPEELRGVLARLNRTGLYETFTGGFFNYGGGKGSTTPNFDKFLEMLSSDIEEFLQ